MMKLILSSSIGGSVKENGIRIPVPLFTDNGFLDMLKQDWVGDAKVLMIVSSPDDSDKNDVIYGCYAHAFPVSGLSIASMDLCDGRNPEAVARIPEMDVVLLSGGHVPTQNAFLKKIGLKERLRNFSGMVIAMSAGAMNCADLVYAGPELAGEAIDPDYQRWITGLGLTDVNILPHYQSLQDEWLDGMRLLEDITCRDSVGHELIALNDGSYIVVDNGRHTLFGEAYRIRDGTIEMICTDGGSIVLKG